MNDWTKMRLTPKQRELCETLKRNNEWVVVYWSSWSRNGNTRSFRRIRADSTSDLRRTGVDIKGNTARALIDMGVLKHSHTLIDGYNESYMFYVLDEGLITEAQIALRKARARHARLGKEVGELQEKLAAKRREQDEALRELQGIEESMFAIRDPENPVYWDGLNAGDTVYIHHPGRTIDVTIRKLFIDDLKIQRMATVEIQRPKDDEESTFDLPLNQLSTIPF